MSKASKVIAVGMGSALAIAGAGQAIALADTPSVDMRGQVPGEAVAADQATAAGRVVSPAVVGAFGFTQAEVSSNEWIAHHIGEASRYLCGSAVVRTGGGRRRRELDA